MKLNELTNTKHSKLLNESVAKQYGYKLKLESFTLEQLQGARDNLSNEIATFERTNAYDAVFEDTSYQRNRALLDVITTAITERTMSADEKSKKEKYVKGMKKVKPDFEKRYGKKNAENVMYATASKMAKESTVDGAMNILRETLLTESSTAETASLIMASQDMVDTVTTQLEKIASLKSETLLQLTDAIRDNIGQEVSTQFSEMVKPSLDDIYDCLERNRTILSNSIAILTGEDVQSVPSDTEQPSMDTETSMGDGFSGTSAASGVPNEVGRMKRESINRNSKKKV